MKEKGDQKFLEKAEELQRQALGVIEEIGLLTKWERAGKPALVGSVRFGLMTKTDIDLHIYVERPDIKAGFEVIQKFALLPDVKMRARIDIRTSLKQSMKDYIGELIM
jgi:hypothetical protein